MAVDPIDPPKGRVNLNSTRTQVVSKKQAEILMDRFGPHEPGAGDGIGDIMARHVGRVVRRRLLAPDSGRR